MMILKLILKATKCEGADWISIGCSGVLFCTQQWNLNSHQRRSISWLLLKNSSPWNFVKNMIITRQALWDKNIKVNSLHFRDDTEYWIWQVVTHSANGGKHIVNMGRSKLVHVLMSLFKGQHITLVLKWSHALLRSLSLVLTTKSMNVAVSINDN
jgi:hypothetical protein